MIIISGKYKGRRLEGFYIDGTRPTMDRVKESLFGMIQNCINNSYVLDLFSGSGNLAIEALSEGASSAYLVDLNKKACAVIKRNIKNIGVSNCNVLCMDYKMALKYFYDKSIKFNIIFLDPPYKTSYIEDALKLISRYDLLLDSGIVVCESDSIDKIVYDDMFISYKEKKYGDKFVVLLKKV